MDDLAKITGISKPYLSLVETNKTKSPPSDEKLTRLERALKFPERSLLVRAHLAKTPADVRGVLHNLLRADSRAQTVAAELKRETDSSPDSPSPSKSEKHATSPATIGINLDQAYLSGALQALVEERAGNISTIPLISVPVVNKVSAGYPQDFTDLAYPARVADEYVPTPAPHAEIPDPYLFAARVHGDSMSPTYTEGDIITFATNTDPQSGQDCFIRLDTGQTTFKRVFFDKDPAGNPIIRLEPLNKKYKTKIFTPERITGIYRAIWVSRAVR